MDNLKMKRIQSLTGMIGLLMIGLALFLLYTRHQREQEKTVENFQSRIDQFINEGPDFLVGTMEKTKDQIVTLLGPPSSLKRKGVQNIHDPEIIDTVYELSYSGLSIRIYEAKASGKGFVQHVSITSDRYPLKWGLKIGDSKEFIKNILGNPKEEEREIDGLMRIRMDTRTMFISISRIMWSIKWNGIFGLIEFV